MNTEKLALAQFTRNPDWPKVRRLFLKQHNQCEVCGITKRLTAHHEKPYQWNPELEMETENLITLCERCHLFVGHLGSWLSYNVNVREDAIKWNAKITSRPKWRKM